MNIYKKEYIPFTYLIGWSSQNKFYYGRKTQKGCHPDMLWQTYFTSSKTVKKFRAEYGEPDIIQIRKIFPNDPKRCAIWENKFLIKVNAQCNPKFLNKRNGDYKWDTSGKILVKDLNDKNILIDSNDPRYLNGELISLVKGKVCVRDKNNKCFFVSINDLRYVNGELTHVSVGIKHSKETIEKRIKYIRGVPKTPEHNRKNSEAHKGKSRILTDEWKENIRQGTLKKYQKDSVICSNCGKTIKRASSNLQKHQNGKYCKR